MAAFMTVPATSVSTQLFNMQTESIVQSVSPERIGSTQRGLP
jgi:hypothetical protein